MRGAAGDSPDRKHDHDRAILLETELARIAADLRKLGARRLVLFGSYARGRVDPFTDLDLLVVLDSELPFVERTAWLYAQLLPRVATDILAYTPKEWPEVARRPFFQKALSEGRVLY